MHNARKTLKSQKGSGGIIYSCMLIMFSVTMIAVMMVTTAAINNINNARRAINQELAAVSYEITEKTLVAMRENNIAEYEQVLTADAAYARELGNTVIRNIQKNTSLNNDNFTFSNLKFNLRDTGTNQVEYTIQGDAVYHLRIQNLDIPINLHNMRFTGRHKLLSEDADSNTSTWYS